MSKYELGDVVCDYGIFEKGELILILNYHSNAKLILDILQHDEKYKSYKKEKEVDVEEVVEEWLSEMKNAEGHCLHCELEQSKTGYTFIDFLNENNIKMYKVGE